MGREERRPGTRAQVREMRLERRRGQLRRSAALALRPGDDDTAPRARRPRRLRPWPRRVPTRAAGSHRTAPSAPRSQRGAAGGAAADQKGGELVVRERGRSARGQTLARMHGLGPFADRDSRWTGYRLPLQRAGDRVPSPSIAGPREVSDNTRPWTAAGAIGMPSRSSAERASRAARARSVGSPRS